MRVRALTCLRAAALGWHRPVGLMQPGKMQPLMVILFSIFLEGGATALKVKMPDEFLKQTAQEKKTQSQEFEPPAPELIQLVRICSENDLA